MAVAEQMQTTDSIKDGVWFHENLEEFNFKNAY